MTRCRTRLLVGALTLIGVLALWAGTSPATTTCGGNATRVAAPEDCTRTKTLFGSTWTAHVHVKPDASGYVTISLAAPRTTDSPVRVTWHDGYSSGPTAYRIDGTIPAGGTTITLTLAKPTFDATQDCGGQLDVKVVEVLGSQSAGRLTAPYITVDRCRAVPPSSSSTSIPGSTIPPTSVPSSVPTTTPGTPVSSVPGSIPELPPTGIDGMTVVLIGACVIVLGTALALGSRRRTS